MFYTDIQTLKGMTKDNVIDYGSGIEDLQSLKQLLVHLRRQQQQQHPQQYLPPYNIQIGLWLNGTQGCRDIIQLGSGDPNTTAAATATATDAAAAAATAAAATTNNSTADSSKSDFVADNIRKMFEILLMDDDDDDDDDGMDNNYSRIHYYLRVGYGTYRVVSCVIVCLCCF